MANNQTFSNSTSLTTNNNLPFITHNGTNKENTTLLWFDPNIGSFENIEQIKQQLHLINDYVVFHTDFESCVTFIQSINKEKIFLIISGSQSQQLLQIISTLPQIHSIFIYCVDKNIYQYLINQYSKIIDIYVDLNELYTSIQEQIDLVDKQLQTFSFFEQNQKTTEDSSIQTAEFLWFQLFNRVFLRTSQNPQAKQQMIDVCRHYYRDNSKELRLIDEFEREYRPEEAIRWYSKQSFVYKLVNKALINKDINQLYTFRFFINDLLTNLIREHEKILLSEEKTLVVYRGVILDKEEFDELKENQGKLMSTNGYLSTSRLHPAALTTATKPTKRLDIVPVIFQIECNIKQLGKSVIFADIGQFSEFPDKQEVLFDLSTAFRLESIEQDGAVQLVRMSASYDGEIVTKDYIEQKHCEIDKKNVAIVFGELLCNLGEYDASQKYFEQLLNDSNGEDLVWVEFNIGRTLHCKGELEDARKYYDRAYDRMMYGEVVRIKDSANVLNNIGLILKRQEKYDIALDYHQRALKIREKYYPSDHVDTAHSLINIGIILNRQEKYDEALNHHQQALKIYEKHYPSDHIIIVGCLNNIGLVLYNQGKYDESLDYYKQALNRQENLYPSNHVEFANSLNNIGNILYNQRKHDEALEYYQRALMVREKYGPTYYMEIAHNLNNIGVILYNQGKYKEAFDYQQRALKIYQNSCSSNHPTIAASLNHIGFILYSQGKYDEALYYHQQALKIRQRCYSSGHRDTAQSLNNIGNILFHQGKYNEALDYHQQALNMREKYYPSGHIEIANSLYNIGIILFNEGKSNEALDYYQRSIKMQQKFCRSEHVDIGDILNRIGHCYENLDKSMIALYYYQQTATIYEKILPVEHPSRIRNENDIHRVSEEN